MRLAGRSGQPHAKQISRQSFDLRRIKNDNTTFAHVVRDFRGPCARPVDVSADNQRAVSIDRVLVSFGCNQYIKYVAEDSGNECLSFTAGWFTFAHRPGIVSGAEEFTQCAIAAIDLRKLERPLRIIGHLPT